MGARDAARLAAPAAAGQRAAASGERRQERAGIAAGADGAASSEPGVCDLPRQHGSAGLRAGELRRDREVARERRGRADRLRDYVAGYGDRQPEGVPRSVVATGRGRASAHDRGKAPDLRARSRRQLSGCAHRAADRAGCGARRLPLVVARPRHRAERPVPAADRAGRRSRKRVLPSCATRSRKRALQATSGAGSSNRA